LSAHKESGVAHFASGQTEAIDGRGRNLNAMRAELSYLAPMREQQE
tara:strand:- start:743 stop:880 length:138 start_codon:yes stop_codon:yes gene_type:complete